MILFSLGCEFGANLLKIIKTVKKVDVLIIGQGIAGSLLALEFEKKGAVVHVIDDMPASNSSKVAAGLYNPITGRKMVKTWLADEIFPDLADYYSSLERMLDGSFHTQQSIYRMFSNIEEQNDWAARSSIPGYDRFVKHVFFSSQQIKNVTDDFGGILIQLCGTISMPELLSKCRIYLEGKGLCSTRLFEFKHLRVESSGVRYEEIWARRIIFSEGTRAQTNPFWKSLRLSPVKGEVLDIKCELNTKYILNRGVFMIPKDGFVRIGSTYDRNDLTNIPTQSGRNQILEKIRKYYSGKIEILDHRAGMRPTSYDRRPFVGFHRKYEPIGIFNGFGTKGVSLVPYFALLLVNHILKGENLMEEVDPNR
jgi:glycine/D-amino acid oxidase-like deaminating enzyme